MSSRPHWNHTRFIVKERGAVKDRTSIGPIWSVASQTATSARGAPYRRDWELAAHGDSAHTGPVNERTQQYRNREAEWETVFVLLRTEGWTVKNTGLAAPLQLEGRLPSGEAFYFRPRHDEVSMGIGGEDPCDSPTWEGREMYGTGSDASYLPGDDGLAILRRLVDEYREG